MDEFSGNRAKARPNRDHSGRPGRRLPRRRAVASLALALLVRPCDPAGAAEHAVEAPPAAAPVAPTAPAPSPERPPPPTLNGPVAAPAPTPRAVWLVDATTGRALGGYDPVGYFLNGRPTLGDPDRQLDWQGVTWLFQDEGTLAAFRDTPEVYAPLFGGHCAFAVSQGRPAEGSPQYFLVLHGKLLLFADAPSRAAFRLDPDRLLADAERRWPAMRADLP